jgi:hypothetical protein
MYGGEASIEGLGSAIIKRILLAWARAPRRKGSSARLIAEKPLPFLINRLLFSLGQEARITLTFQFPVRL